MTNQDLEYCNWSFDEFVDLVNSQQEAIEKLEKRLSFFEVYGNPSSPPPEPADNKATITTVGMEKGACMTSNKLRAKICEIFGIFPEELEHNLPVNIGLNKIKKLEALLEEIVLSDEVQPNE